MVIGRLHKLYMRILLHLYLLGVIWPFAMWSICSKRRHIHNSTYNGAHTQSEQAYAYVCLAWHVVRVRLYVGDGKVSNNWKHIVSEINAMEIGALAFAPRLPLPLLFVDTKYFFLFAFAAL